MEINYWAVLSAAFIPLLVGAIWYNPKVLGSRWMLLAKLNEADLKNGKMAVLFGVSFILALMLAFYMPVATIHQWSIYSLMMNDLQSADPSVQSAAQNTAAQLMSQYGSEFRTFGHGMLHGFMLSLFVVFPVMATNALFERKSWAYIFLNWGYWAISIMLMGGVVCQWG